jgi:hypothetical protein
VARRGKPSKGIGGFAEDLGRLLGTAQAKAQGWIGQRHTIVKQLQQIRDTAAGLLSELTASPPPRRRGGRRSATDAARLTAAPVVRRRRKLTAKARKAISDAQKRRWAAVRAAKK